MSDDEMNMEMEIDEPLVKSPSKTGFPSTSEVVGIWNEKFHDPGGCTLNITHFKEHWRLYVPEAINLDPSIVGNFETVFDEENVQNILIAPLEEFICGGDPKEVWIDIIRNDDPPTVCGRVFKTSEPTYNCRECGTDPTCVLCVECFKKSEHRNHKYKMSTSGGGGCCDCGDVEAWKKHPYCSAHTHNTGTECETDSSKFPLDVLDRCRITFRAALQYAYQLLSIDHEPKLPIDLRLKEAEDDPMNCLDALDSYCCVIYNDETHTFDQVIGALTKVVKCSRKDAHEYVTNIDKDGRCVVKCSTFQHCSELKTEIERLTSRHNNQCLKVQVKHTHVIAHQSYAIRLLKWIEKLLSYSKHIRQVFSQTLLEEIPTNTSVLKGILQRDTVLWKSARLHWHALFILGMLREYENKKAFAIVFVKMYSQITKDHIRDDHEYSYSVCSLGVQIFTVPSIAHHLIAHADVLLMMFNTFWSECNPFLKDGKLEFQKRGHNTAIAAFRRAQIIMYDIQCLISNIPEEWTDDLRKGFLDGFLTFLKLINAMQGMDSVARQVGQHLEFEPEWETAFHVHIKLSSITSFLTKWCGSDRIALIKCYRNTLKKLLENACPSIKASRVVQEIADHSASVIDYDVSEKPISIHIPLSRIFAGLYIQLEKYNLQFYSSEFSMQKPTPIDLIEPVLRAQVMIAQVHAGLWRRNGYSILHQIYFYHNVKCRSEMLNKDIILLQIGASLIEGNEFLIHVISKYKLMDWASPDFEKKCKEDDTLRQTMTMVEEFLYLLIVIICERYVVGVGKVNVSDCVKKEIIQQLCIRSMSHSELSKALSEKEIYDIEIDSVINQVATFNKPTSAIKGMYHLKPHLRDQYNVFCYHYSKEDLSRSEETQRKCRKDEGLLDCCPPPPLPNLCQNFMLLVDVLQCDVMCYIMQLVLERARNLQARSFSESQLHRVLYLIGLALNEEDSRNFDFFIFTERCEKWNILKSLEGLLNNPRVDVYRDLIKWTISKYKAVAIVTSKLRKCKNYEEGATSSKAEDKTFSEKDLNFKNCQSDGEKSDYIAGDNTGVSEKNRISRLAADRRRAIMEAMNKAQQTFIEENAQLYEEATASDKTENIDICSTPAEIVDFPVAVGNYQTSCQPCDLYEKCILCQEYQLVNTDGPAMIYGAYVQKSNVICNNIDSPIQKLKPESLYFQQSNLSPSIFTSICGHVMHSTCWERFFNNLTTKEIRRTYRLRHPISFDVEASEFLCPLCESLNNTVLPVLPSLKLVTGAKSCPSNNISFQSWLTILRRAGEKKHEEILRKERATNSKRMKKTDITDEAVFDETSNILDMDTDHSDTNSITELRSHWMEVVERDSGASTSSSLGIDSAVTASVQFSDDESTNDDFKMEVVLLESKEKLALGLEMDDVIHSTDENQIKHKPILSKSIVKMINKFCKSIYQKGLGQKQSENNSHLLYCWKSCAYTIHVVEQLMRYENRPLLEDMSTRHNKCIESLIKLCCIHEKDQSEKLNSYALMMLCLVLDCNNQMSSACVLDWDPFGLLVALVISLPSLFFHDSPAPFPNGSIMDAHVIRLMLLATVFQIMTGVDLEMDNCEDKQQPQDEDTQCLIEYMEVLNMTSDNRKISKSYNTTHLWKQIIQLAVPFLRCCCIFFRFLTEVTPPACLTQLGGDTYDNMCKYLGIPSSCKELLAQGSDGAASLDMFRSWANQWKKCCTVEETTNKILKFDSYFTIRHLIDLPNDYSELINSASLFVCSNSDSSRNPTLCLICGTMLCSQTYCCQKEVDGMQVGACTYHASVCGAGAGIFLRVRDCDIVMLSFPNRGCAQSSPYLDEYGESDIGLRRGNPLTLCRDTYKRLERMWLSHLIHEEVSRSLESSNTLAITPWQNL